jgi:hypothetical protein
MASILADLLNTVPEVETPLQLPRKPLRPRTEPDRNGPNLPLADCRVSGELFRTCQVVYEGQARVDIRRWIPLKSGELHATRFGIWLPQEEWDDFVQMVNTADRKLKAAR